MPTLNIGTKSVQVDDGFLKLSPEQQNATVDEIAKSIGPAAWGAIPVESSDPTSWGAVPVAQPQPNPKAPSMTEGVGRSFAEGVPILGGLANKLDAATNAALAPIADRFLPDSFEKLPEATFGERYQHALDIQNRKSKTFETEHPVASTAAGITGGIASTLPLAATTTGAKLLGLTGETLPAQMGFGAASSGVIGGIDALVRGENPASAGLIGAAAGGITPGAAKAVGALAAPLVNAARGIINPAEQATRVVGNTLANDIRTGGAGLAQPEFAAAQAVGAPLTVMEAGGQGMRDLARSAANTSAEGAQILNKAIDSRFESQSGRLNDWLRSTFHYPNASAQEEALKQTARNVNGPAYSRAYQAGDREIWSPELERLTAAPYVQNALGGAMSKWKNYAVRDGYGAMNPPFRVENGGLIKTERVAAQVAKLLVSQDPQKISNAMKLIAASPKMLGALRLTSSNLASIVARGATPSVAVAADTVRPAVNVPVSPAWRRQALINAVVAAQGAAAQRDQQAANAPWIPAALPKGPKFSTAPQ
jgi:hypothetical protein